MNDKIIPGKPRRRRGKQVPVATWTPLKPEDQAKSDAWHAEFNRLDQIRGEYAKRQRFTCRGMRQIYMGDVSALEQEFVGLVPRQTIAVVVQYKSDRDLYIAVPQSPFIHPANTGEYGLGTAEGGEVYQVWNHFTISQPYLAGKVHHIGTIDTDQLADIVSILDAISTHSKMPDSERIRAQIGPREQCTPQLMQYFNFERRVMV